jgi:hypothetical protein
MLQGSPSTKRRAVLENPVNVPTNLHIQPKTKNSRTHIIARISNQSTPNVQQISSKAAAFNRSQLANFISSASWNGLTPSKIAKLCYRIDALEKKYGLTYEELKNKFEETAKSLDAKTDELRKLEAEIALTSKKKKDLMEQYYLNEKQVQDYVDARDALLSIGFEIDKLPNVKNSLLAMKKENYDPNAISEKINAIGDLESRRNALQNDLNSLNGEMRAKKTLLVQIKKLQDTGLNADQIERIRDVVSKISSNHGINPDQSFERFEKDVMKHYSATLGLEAEVTMLQESKDAINRENDQKRKALEQAEKELSQRNKKLEESYAAQKEELKAFSELRANGVDGPRIIAWQKLIEAAKIDPELLDSEIRNIGSLSSLEEQTKLKIKDLEEKKKAAEEALLELNRKKEAIELSIGSVKESSIGQIEETSSKALSSISEISKQVKLSTENAREDLETTLSQVKSSASLFSKELNESLKDVGPALKNVSQAIEAARAIGKYEAILPLFKLTEGTQSNKITETEALVALWNVTNAFNSWIKNHYPNEELELSEPLEKMIQALDEEIHGIGREEDESTEPTESTEKTDESDESNES